MPRMKIHQLETQEACTHEVSWTKRYEQLIFLLLEIFVMQDLKFLHNLHMAFLTPDLVLSAFKSTKCFFVLLFYHRVFIFLWKCFFVLSLVKMCFLAHLANMPMRPMQSWFVHHVSLSSSLVSSVSLSVYSYPSDSITHRNFHILQIHVHISLIYAHEILGQFDVYFWNGSHFNKILDVALLSTWLSLEPLHLAQLCIYTGATHREKIMHLQIIFLKLWIFKKNYILHFLAHILPKILTPTLICHCVHDDILQVPLVSTHFIKCSHWYPLKCQMS